LTSKLTTAVYLWNRWNRAVKAAWELVIWVLRLYQMGWKLVTYSG